MIHFSTQIEFLPEILDVHDILALKMSHASTIIMNDRQKPQNFQNQLNAQQRCVNFVNHLDRIRVLATLCLVKSKVINGYSPHELFMRRFLHAPYPADSYSTVEKWVKEQQDKVDQGKVMLQRVKEGQWTKKNRHRVPACYQQGDWVLMHHSRLSAYPRCTGDDRFFEPYKILTVDGHRIIVRCSPRLGGTLVCAAEQLKHYYNPQAL